MYFMNNTMIDLYPAREGVYSRDALSLTCLGAGD